MSKVGVIYLSLSGNTTSIAQKIKQIDSDIELYPITIEEKIPRTKLMQVIKYGYKTIFNRHIEFSFDDKKIDSLDGIIIGSPVWMGRIPSPVRDIISALDLKGKKVAGFCTYDGDPGDFQDQLYAFTDSPPFSGFISLREPLKLKGDDFIKDLRDLVLALLFQINNIES